MILNSGTGKAVVAREECVENNEVEISESDDRIPTLPMSRDDNLSQATAMWVEVKC
jgi:hypothetical protein